MTQENAVPVEPLVLTPELEYRIRSDQHRNTRHHVGQITAAMGFTLLELEPSEERDRLEHHLIRLGKLFDTDEPLPPPW